MGSLTGAPPALATIGPPRLLAGLDRVGRLDRVAHLTQHGSLPELRQEEVVALAENTDLRGRGGAGFPFARKLRAVIESAGRKDGRSAVVVNGSEGEPSCLKDTTLLLLVPHMVLDGAALTAAALGSEEIVIGVTREDVEESVRAAVAERGPAGVPMRVNRLPERFVTGEGTALTSGLNNGPALPAGRKVRSSESGLKGLPTLLSNAETYAQLGLAARLGALAYREVGLPNEPGTVLLTVAGAWVVETPTGIPLPYVLEVCGIGAGQGVLVGGYHGRWLGPDTAQSALISRGSLAEFDAVLGAGAVLPLPEGTCPVGETLRVARWMAAESAGQCGPCVLGLPALADALAHACQGGGRAALDAVHARIRAVRGRGACSHPDGTSHFVASALAAFPDDFSDHALGSGCGRPVLGALPLPMDEGAPPTEPAEQLVVNWTLCQGHGLCADIIPGVIRLDVDGYPAQATMPLPSNLRPQALRAVRRCPALALRIQE
ncbi:NADH-ubiquinone oxidoreductase-F iron-sulfur binding region domain-containing protein [Streptomyces sp. H27-D2]|uniref:NADH-ubiquinone oxidoreductase-F iron-sulfur binding region domain-containing protein n=1 Tax=Streptomyces sp. H27-D2 TaxID=3046304 RepID=UPI002DB66B38|nr:NADH-ubiquinone oxidoreductase-F iron-sulfur binding region domain-containing protein [Streptomyces sp. H27-D2]MEC4019572.1 NADH-ubiquinone oxidoreductase-F iron-sulfur binding region domain-containing protein [Streptomyces sp. H27-D2]